MEIELNKKKKEGFIKFITEANVVLKLCFDGRIYYKDKLVGCDIKLVKCLNEMME